MMLEFNSVTPGLSIVKKELNKSKLPKFIDEKFPKHSGFPISKIISTCICKNVMNIKTFTETSEEFLNSPEHEIDINRTTLARNCKRIGQFDKVNIFLESIVKYILKKFKPKSNAIRIIVDGTTIEVYKNSKYEGADWVWDSAEGKVVWGYDVTIIAISFGGIYLPIYFELGNISKDKLLKKFISIKEMTKSNIVIFDGGYASDDFYKSLSRANFIFYTKAHKNWIFNNGLNLRVDEIKEGLNLESFYAIKLYRVEKKEITDEKYYLCFKEGDPRVLITNDLREEENEIAKKCFKEFKKRWDIETCNSELKSNFCFEKLPTRNKEGIVGYLITSFLALCVLTIIKLKHRRELGDLFNKGFRKFIRHVLLIKARWCFKKLSFFRNFKFGWFYRDYGFM